jgi:hypothetical protein
MRRSQDAKTPRGPGVRAAGHPGAKMDGRAAERVLTRAGAPAHRGASVRMLTLARMSAVAAGFLAVTAAAAVAQQTSLTIYQDGRVMVRRALPVAVPRGTSTTSVDLGGRGADPTSLVALDEGVEVRGVRVSAATGLEGSLRRALGREVDFVLGGDSMRFVRGTVLSLDPPAFRVGGRVVYDMPGRPAFPDSLVQLAPQAEVTVEAARPVRTLRVAYLAQGLSWHAAYTLVAPASGAGRATMAGAATIGNPGALAIADAEVQLLAGDVRRAPTPGAYAMDRVMAAPTMAMARAAEAPSEEAVGESHVYTLPGTVDFVPGTSRTVALFAQAAPLVERSFAFRASGYGHQQQWRSPEQDLHAEVTYLVRRPAGAPFGDTPLPAGVVRVLVPDSAGRVQLLGEVPIQHTPAGRELKLATGTAFDITAQRTQLTFVRQGPRQVEVSYRVQIQNAKSDSATVQVYEEFPAQWEVLASTVRAERLSSTSVRFAVPVPAAGEATLEYRARVRW